MNSLKHGLNKYELWSLVVLEVLFAACATSVVVYQVSGRFDFGFGFLSYRFFNIALSILCVGYIIWALIKKIPRILVFVGAFSLFHFAEGLIISFWFKVVIHLLILVIVGAYCIRNKTFLLGKKGEN